MKGQNAVHGSPGEAKGIAQVRDQAGAVFRQGPSQVSFQPLVTHAGTGPHGWHVEAHGQGGPDCGKVGTGGGGQGHRAVEAAVEVDEAGDAVLGHHELHLRHPEPVEGGQQGSGQLADPGIHPYGLGAAARAGLRRPDARGHLHAVGHHPAARSRYGGVGHQMTLVELLDAGLTAQLADLLDPAAGGVGVMKDERVDPGRRPRPLRLSVQPGLDHDGPVRTREDARVEGPGCPETHGPGQAAQLLFVHGAQDVPVVGVGDDRRNLVPSRGQHEDFGFTGSEDNVVPVVANRGLDCGEKGVAALVRRGHPMGPAAPA